MCFGKQIDQIGGETGTETLAECAAVTFLGLDEISVDFADGILEHDSVNSRFQFRWKPILELNRSAYKGEN